MLTDIQIDAAVNAYNNHPGERHPADREAMVAALEAAVSSMPLPAPIEGTVGSGVAGDITA